MKPHDPHAWFAVRQRIELAWGQRKPVELTAHGVESIRDELCRLDAVRDKCVDISQGDMPDQHRRDLQALLVRLGYLEPRAAA